MATFTQTIAPTPFGIYDAEVDFQLEADAMITFVKRKLGDDILSVELTKKQIWMCFEEATLEYSRMINTNQAKSQLGNLLGNDITGGENNEGPSGAEQKFPRETVEYLLRKAEPYASAASVGGSHNLYSGSIEMSAGQQDYNIYTDLKFTPEGTTQEVVGDYFSGKKLHIVDVLHKSPQAAYRFFDTTSAINYLNNEFAFESFTPETVFYVLPVYEDVLRQQQMSVSNRVRRSNYSYEVIGENLRIFPMPTEPKVLWIRFRPPMDGLNPDVQDDSIDGVSGISNLPFGNITFSGINSVGRQWIRQYTIALAKEVLGQVRSKFGSVPIPNGDLSLNGGDLLSQASTEKDKLMADLKELLDSMTYDKLIETQAAEAENLQRLLKTIPVPLGKCISIG
jgi:hypothetical protein